jgi:hypothetical protein
LEFFEGRMKLGTAYLIGANPLLIKGLGRVPNGYAGIDAIGVWEISTHGVGL